jgi:hypothetical protein
MVHVTRRWFYKLTRMRARRLFALDASWTHTPVISEAVLSLSRRYEQFIPELPQVKASSGAPWLWLIRRFQDNCVVVLREIRGQRLQGGRNPNRQEHLAASSCDAGILVEIVENWTHGWQIPYIVMRIATRGLYAHPDVLDLVVQGVRVHSYVEEILHFVNRRGCALSLLDAKICGRYENPWEGDEPHP